MHTKHLRPQVRLSRRLEAGVPVDMLVSVANRPAKSMRLVVVSRSLGYYRRLRAKATGDGFAVTETFPRAGDYRMFVDADVGDVGRTILPVDLAVKGESRRTPPQCDCLTPSVWTDGRYHVALANEAKLSWGKRTELTLQVALDGAPVTDVEGHAGVAVREWATELIPIGAKSRDAEALSFGVSFPEPGTYCSWLELRHRGLVVTPSFLLSVT